MVPLQNYRWTHSELTLWSEEIAVRVSKPFTKKEIANSSQQLWSSGSLIQLQTPIKILLYYLSETQLLSVHPILQSSWCSSPRMSLKPEGIFSLQFMVKSRSPWFCAPWMKCSENDGTFLKVRQPIWSMFTWVRQFSHHVFPERYGYFLPPAGSLWELQHL